MLRARRALRDFPLISICFFLRVGDSRIVRTFSVPGSLLRAQISWRNSRPLCNKGIHREKGNGKRGRGVPCLIFVVSFIISTNEAMLSVISCLAVCFNWFRGDLRN